MQNRRIQTWPSSFAAWLAAGTLPLLVTTGLGCSLPRFSRSSQSGTVLHRPPEGPQTGALTPPTTASPNVTKQVQLVGWQTPAEGDTITPHLEEETVSPQPPIRAASMPKLASSAELPHLDTPDELETEFDAGNSIRDYVARALAVHPSIAAARHRIAAAQQRIPQATALSDPTLSETFWPFRGNALETAGGRAASQITVSQAVPWPKKRKTRGAIACREVQIARAELAEIEQEVAESVRLACIEVWLANKALEIIDESSHLVQDLNEISEARYRSGAGSQQDVLRAQLEGDRLDDQRAEVVGQLAGARADLAALLHEKSPRNFQVDGIEQVDGTTQIDELLGMADQCSPAIQGLIAQVARDREKQRLACLEKYPDFQVGMSWLIVSDRNALSPVATGNDNFGFTVGLTLPVWREKIRAGIREANHATSSSAQLLDSEKDTTAGKIRRLVALTDSLIEQEEIHRGRIIPRTQDTLELALADYRGGRTDFFSVIETYRELLILELQSLRIRASMVGSLAQLERAVGCPIVFAE